MRKWFSFAARTGLRRALPQAASPLPWPVPAQIDGGVALSRVSIAAILLVAALSGWPGTFANLVTANPVSGDPLSGSGNVSRTLLSGSDLFWVEKPPTSVH